MTSKRSVLLVGAVMLVAVRAPAEPSSQEKAMASQLFDDAEKLIADGNTAQACPKYAESQRLDPQLGTLLHLGECYARAEKPASAWASFKDALEIAVSRSDPREARIRQRVAELERNLPKLVIQVPDSAPADLEIRQDGNVVGRAVWGSALPVDPGNHAVTAAAAGMKPWSGSVQVGPGASTARLAIPPLTPEPKTATPPAAPLPAGATGSTGPDASAASGGSPRGSTQRIIGWTTAGVGVVGIGIGIAFEIQRASKVSQRDSLCPMDTCDTTGQQDQVATLTNEARTASTIATVGFVAGGVLAAGGLVLVFTAPHGDSSSSVSAFPVVARGFQGIALTGRVF